MTEQFLLFPGEQYKEVSTDRNRKHSQRLASKRYRQSHKKEVSTREREYRQSHKEIIATKISRYRQSHKEEIKTKGQEYRQSHKEKISIYDRKKRLQKYKITQDIYDKLMAAQNGNCALCNKSFKDIPQHLIHIDHDHLTGKVRGILCHNCNAVLGFLHDNAENAQKALNYLLKHIPDAPA